MVWGGVAVNAVSPSPEIGGAMPKKYMNKRDSFGRQKTTYHNVPHFKRDCDECVREIEENMIRYCADHQMDFSFVSKLKVAKLMGCDVEYRNALYGKRKFS